MPKRGNGTTISIGTTPTLIGNLTNITPPERTRDLIDATTLGAVDDYKKSIPGLKDGGEVTLKGYYEDDDAGILALDTAFEAGTEDTYAITYPAPIGAKITFPGIITKFLAPGEANISDPLGFEVTIKVNGKPNLSHT